MQALVLQGNQADGEMLTAFEDWLNEYGNTLAVPLKVVERKPESIRLNFVGLTPMIEVVVARQEIAVAVIYEGQCWDLLVVFESAPLAVADGIVCGLCDPDKRVVYPTRASLYCAHMFQPLADWIVTSLAASWALGLDRSDEGGSTWATLLVTGNDRGYSIAIPLRG